MRVISFSLFGGQPKYDRGAVENARLAAEIYPGWRCRFYCDPQTTVADELLRLGAELVARPEAPGGLAMCWRFLPAADRTIERVIFRDCDSRLNVREAAAVEEWVASGLPAHCMHDHEHHRPWPIFGGMWGCVGGALPRMPQWIAERRQWRERLDDMVLLRDQAWPVLERQMMRHSSVPVEWESRTFPAHEEWGGFVGQVVG